MPNDWYIYINEKENKVDIDTIRNCINRQAPLGDLPWQEKVAKAYGLESTLKPRGRPWKK